MTQTCGHLNKECGIFSRAWFSGAAEDLEYQTNEVVEKSDALSQVKADCVGAMRSHSARVSDSWLAMWDASRSAFCVLRIGKSVTARVSPTA